SNARYYCPRRVGNRPQHLTAAFLSRSFARCAQKQDKPYPDRSAFHKEPPQRLIFRKKPISLSLVKLLWTWPRSLRRLSAATDHALRNVASSFDVGDFLQGLASLHNMIA